MIVFLFSMKRLLPLLGCVREGHVCDVRKKIINDRRTVGQWHMSVLKNRKEIKDGKRRMVSYKKGKTNHIKKYETYIKFFFAKIGNVLYSILFCELFFIVAILIIWIWSTDNPISGNNLFTPH